MARKILYCLLIGLTSLSMTMMTACCETSEEVDEDDPANGDDNYNYDEICNDRADNDGDGKTDCDDLDCFNELICRGNPEPDREICGDRVDNDRDGATDCDDTDCSRNAICIECNPPCGPDDRCEDGTCISDGNNIGQVEPCRNVGQFCEAGSNTDNLVCAARNTLETTEATCHNRCNPNNVDADCPSGTMCIGEDDDGFCIRSNCTSPVLSAEECSDIGPNGGQCTIARNDTFLCLKAGTLAAGGDCVGPIVCQGGLTCHNGTCAAYCNAGDDASCAEGDSCLPVATHDSFGICALGCPNFDTTDECGENQGCFPITEDQGFCIDTGDVLIGEPCDEENLCEPLSTCRSLNTEDQATCRTFCDRTEGNGNENCDSNEICLEINDVFGACFPGCEPFMEETGCEEEGKLTCLPIHDDRGICIESGEVASEAACDSASLFGECAAGLACHPQRDENGASTDGLCSPICRPFSSVGDEESGCAANQLCAVQDAQWGICETFEGESLNTGDPCSPNTVWCSNDNLCVPTNQQGDGLCIAMCRLTNGDNDCPDAQRCTDGFFEAGTELGFCIP